MSCDTNNINITAIVKDWYIVSLYSKKPDETGYKHEVAGQILWGIIDNPLSSHWNYNDYICTTQINKINDKKELIYTQNSIYKTKGHGGCYLMRLKDVFVLRTGISPPIVEAFLKDNEISS